MDETTNDSKAQLDVYIKEEPVEGIENNSLSLKEELTEYFEEFKHVPTYVRTGRTTYYKKEYKCEICNYKCHYSRELLKAIIKRHLSLAIHCKKCNYHCLSVPNLRKHEESCDAVPKCEVCLYEFELKSQLLEHEKIHNGGDKADEFKFINSNVTAYYKKQYKCNVCNYTCYFNKEQLKCIIENHHSSVVNCKKCKYHCLTEAKLKEHEESCEGVLQCEVCLREFYVKSELLEHEKIHIGKNSYTPIKYFEELNCASSSALKSSMKEYKCNMCNYKYRYSREPLQWIIKRHHNLAMHCKKCDFHCLVEAELIKHEENCNAVSKCKVCIQKFELKSELEEHNMQIHTGEKSYEEWESLEEFKFVNSKKLASSEKEFKCNVCNYVCHYKKEPLERVIENHKSLVVYCKKCNFHSLTEAQLKVHEESCEGIFRCEVCLREFYAKGELVEHEEIHTGEKSCTTIKYFEDFNCANLSTLPSCRQEYKCEICNYTCHFTRELLMWVIKRHRGLAIHCKNCNFHCLFEAELTKHKESCEEHEQIHTKEKSSKRTVHNEDANSVKSSMLPSSKKEYKCEVCSYKCHYGKESLKWIIKRHLDVAIFCKTCNFHCLLEGELSNHEESCVAKCEFCLQEFDSKSELLKHQQIHTKQTFRCEKCDYYCSRRGDLKKHMVIAHQGLFRCTMCNYSDVFENLVKVHARSHSKQPLTSTLRSKSSALRTKRVEEKKKEKQFTCEKCGKTFLRLITLKIHAISHTGEKPFKCTLCPKEFTSSKARKKHSLTHSGLKPYCCHVCEYKCTSRDRLNCHLRVHTGEKPFKCLICDYTCSYKVSLNNHMQVHTGKQFYCELCDYECSDKITLKRHVKNHDKKKKNVKESL